MPSWIEEEAERYRVEKEEQQQRLHLINTSNYWTVIRQQVEKDVGEINNHPVWKEALKGSALVIQNTPDGYQVQKTTFPAVYVTVRNKDGQILLQTETKEIDDKTASNREESLPLDVEDGKVVLKNSQQSYIVPDEAARYILSSLVKALKK